MPYLHGVYTSEAATSVVPSVNAASCLPFVIGTAPEGYAGDALVRCRTWAEFKSKFGAADAVTGADVSTIAGFGRQWYKRAGASDALFYSVPASEAEQEIVDKSSDLYFADADSPVSLSGSIELSHSPSDTPVISVDKAWVLSFVDNSEFTYTEQPNISIATELSDGPVDAVIYADADGSYIGSLRGTVREGYAIFEISGLNLDVNAVYNCCFGVTRTEISNSAIALSSTSVSGGVASFTATISSSQSGPVCCQIKCAYHAASLPASAVSDALTALDSVYEQFGLVPTVILCPRFGLDYAAEIAAKVQKFGSGWSAIALLDIPYTWADATPTLPLKSSYLVYCSPRCQAGDEIVDASCAVAGAMAYTDAQAGGFPYVSPSNKLAYIDGTVDEDGQPLFMSQPDVNDLFNANAVVSFLHNAKGWVVWGNNTGYYSPSATDPKDRWVSVRRTFCYVRNDFLIFGASRIDNPINKRQLDGVINAYNQRLKGLVGVGAVNSASVALSDTNTAETLLGGAVYLDVFISPPPPMEQLSATFEYDVEGFVSSLD